MTAAFLQSELASLIQDSKRRQSDVRTAAEKSLADLKAIQVTSETQLAGDLLRRPQFVDPFILACHSKYVKLAVTGAICLQRLIASGAIPTSRLTDILDAFQEAAQQGLDVQLKILQALPSLLQLYATELYGEALAKILSLCASLVGSKTGLVSSSAIATFQQLITTLFERQARKGSTEDDTSEGMDDAVRVMEDMCMIICGEQPQYLKSQGLTLPIALEVVELSLSSPNFAIMETPSCLSACEVFLIPGINRILEKSTSFAAFGRSLRVLYLLVAQELDRVLKNLSDSFSTVLSIMDRPSGPPWRRLLCLEFMRNIINDSQLFRSIYFLFDRDENKQSVVGSLMSILVRIAAEDPSLIGLGRQSTIPTNTENDSAGVGGAHVDIDAVGSVLQASSNVTGISSRWSTLSSPLLEQLENQVTPDIPETYIYTLVLSCVASLSDGLSKFVMPLSVPNRWSSDSMDTVDGSPTPTRKNSQVRRAEKYQRLLNPLKRDDLPNKDEVEACAKLIEDCWPAVLATCSTFLNSALDSHFYHILVRTVQKLAQVSGVLELFTPRDALLTTLAKVSVPVNASSIVTAFHGSKLAKISGEDTSDEDEASIRSPIHSTPRMSVDVSRQPLNVRNLLCLRALLNLGIALGPTLSETSWFIIIQALQQADALMSVNPATRAAASRAQAQDEVDTEGQTSLGSEITAVGTASKRMMESTKTYPDDVLVVFLRSVFKMIDTLIPGLNRRRMSKSRNGHNDLIVTNRKHKPTRSVSGSVATAAILHIEAEFVLKTINDVARINLYRFCSRSSQACTWDTIVMKLLAIVADSHISPQLRLQSSNVLNSISMEVMRMLEKQTRGSDERDELQNMCLNLLAQQLSTLYAKDNAQPVLATDVDIHRRMLEALEDIVSHCGESLTGAWRMVFDILQKTTRQTESSINGAGNLSVKIDSELILERTIPPAFRTVQLIVSDFLSSIDPLSFSILIQLLRSFGVQGNDLNISLTTTVLFSNLSSLLLERTDSIEITALAVSTANGSDNKTAPEEGRPNDISSLWFATILQICVLCKDNRGDVRNSALRVLIRVLESSSPQLTAHTWNVLYQRAILPLLGSYCGRNDDGLAWQASFAQMLEGVVGLFVQNIEIFTSHGDFATTWEIFVGVLNSKLSEQSLEGHKVVFLSTSELLQALRATKVEGSGFVLPVSHSWFKNHPADIPIEDESNQDALRAHAKLFTAMTQLTGNVLNHVEVDGENITDVAVAATKRAALACVHPPYSSDVSKLSSEQVAIVENLEVIKSMMSSQKQAYTNFLLDLIQNILMRNSATEVEKQTIGKSSKKLQRPTLIALLSSCIDLLRSVIKEEAGNESFLDIASTRDALTIMTKVTASKYSNIPSNATSPAWKYATSAMVELVEAIQNHAHHMSPNLVVALSAPLYQALEAVVTAPALEGKIAALSTETIFGDENIDIEQFLRLHKASLRLLDLRDFPDHQRKQYVLTIFHASLIAKPWFGDLTSDLVNKPLTRFKDLRPGSIRPPDFLPRAQIPYKALDALLGLVDRRLQSDSDPENLVTATAAAPYVLLRIAHSIKVFMADQRLRNLTPPPRPSLRELNIVLNKCLDLKVADKAFSEILPAASAGDGKIHLRILYPLVLRFKEFWAKLPRLKVCAWQDTEDGKGVRAALDRWGVTLADEWDLGLS